LASLLLVASTQPFDLMVVLGDGGSSSSALLRANGCTGALSSPVLTFGTGDDGETLAFHPPSGDIFHWSGISDGSRCVDRSSFPYSTHLPASPDHCDSAGNGRTEALAAVWDETRGQFIVSDRHDYFMLQDPGMGYIGQTNVYTGRYLKGLVIFTPGVLHACDRQGAILYTYDLVSLVETGSCNLSDNLGSDIDACNGMTTDGTTVWILYRVGGDKSPRHIGTINLDTCQVRHLSAVADKPAGLNIALCPASGCGCGNGMCEPMYGETCECCSLDCGPCSVSCGDGFCDTVAGEDAFNCAADCAGGSSPSGTPTPNPIGTPTPTPTPTPVNIFQLPFTEASLHFMTSTTEQEQRP